MLQQLGVNPLPLAHYQRCSMNVHSTRMQPKTKSLFRYGGWGGDIVTPCFNIYYLPFKKRRRQKVENDLVKQWRAQELDMMNPKESIIELLMCFFFFFSPFFLTGTSLHGAEFGHVPDNITVLEGESVTLR